MTLATEQPSDVRKPRVHVLLTHPLWWDRINDGSKTAELRKHDRDFQVGDELVLVREDESIWGVKVAEKVRILRATISHILPASVFPDGLQPGYSMLSLALQIEEEEVDRAEIGLAPWGDR